ncbi:MAG: DUF6273 domain-containing protein [Lachnospiraceae bacterium]
MKKWYIMLAFAMLLLSGCGKQAESTEVITEESNTEEPEPATTEALETVTLKDAEIGDIVQMGTYEQDGDAETEDPICWDVLDKDGDAVLLISHDVIAYQRFSDSRKCVIWEDSEIRTWLNQEFYAEAFDEEEQASIRETTLENLSTVGFAAHVDPSGDVQVRESRPDTKDKIFLLSWKEAEQYYGNRLTDASVLGRRPSRAVLQKRKAIFTDLIIEELPAMYPYSRHLPDGTERLSWMLRSTGMKNYTIFVIGYEGKWDQDYPDSYNGVRPAMWVNVGD